MWLHMLLLVSSFTQPQLQMLVIVGRTEKRNAVPGLPLGGNGLYSSTSVSCSSVSRRSTCRYHPPDLVLNVHPYIQTKYGRS